MRPAPINLFDYEALAQEMLPTFAYDYYASGAHDERTVRDNRSAYDRIRLAPRVLVDVSACDLSTTVLGARISIPVMIAPMAFQRLAHPEGEAASARAAAHAGTIMILSTVSTTPVEDVVRAAGGPVWFQLYVFKDRAATQALIERAEAAGCAALVVTVDAPVLGRRERDIRNQFTLPPELSLPHLASQAAIGAGGADSPVATYLTQVLDSSLTWRDLEWLRSITRLPIVIKGVLRADDAVRAVEHGVAAIAVSNHGGRQLDTAIATIDALGPIVEAVEGRAEVYVDGGVRRGTDVLKALALGARAVLLGRPVLWGLAAGGADGVSAVLDLLTTEIHHALALCGCPRIADVSRDLLVMR